MKVYQVEKLLSKVGGIGPTYKHIRSIMLVGSGSRDELRVIDDKIVSDLEFVFFIDHFFISKRAVAGIISKLATEFDIQIDVSFIHGYKNMRFPKRLFFYDLTVSGKVIYGEDIVGKRLPLKAAELHVKDVTNIIFYRVLDVLINSPVDSISRESLCRNMSYVYLYVLINEGILEKSFRSRFASIESLAKTSPECRSRLANSFFSELGPDYHAVRSARLDFNTSAIGDHEVGLLLEKMLCAIDHAISLEKTFTLLHNFRYVLRFIRAVFKSPFLFLSVRVFISLNPRKKLLIMLKKELINRDMPSVGESTTLTPILLKKIYGANFL